MDEQERQRRLRALQGSDEMDREAYGLAPEQQIAADPSILKSLQDFAMPQANAQERSNAPRMEDIYEGGRRAFGVRPSPSPSPIESNDGLLDQLSAWAASLGKQTQAAPSPSPTPIDPNHPLFRMRKKAK